MTAKDSTGSNYLTIGASPALGFGAMRMPDKVETTLMVDEFLASGGNYFDTAWIYGGSEEMLREVLVKRHPRDTFLIADKLPPWEVKNHADCEQLFAKQLKRTGCDFFDFYLVHSLDDAKENEVEEMRLFDWACEQKEKGRVRHVGFSFHGTTEYLARVLQRHPEAEFVQLQLNYSDVLRGPAGEWQQLAIKHGVPIIVMEPVKGGSLAALPAPAEAILRAAAPERSIASWAIQYAASLENVTCVLSGMSNIEQLRDNVKTFEDMKPLTADELALLQQVLAEMGKIASIPCTACKYCHAHCPQGVDIASCFSFYNELKRGGSDWNVRMSYRTLPENIRAAACVSCGICHAHCPQHINISGELSSVADTFKS